MEVGADAWLRLFRFQGLWSRVQSFEVFSMPKTVPTPATYSLPL